MAEVLSLHSSDYLQEPSFFMIYSEAHVSTDCYLHLTYSVFSNEYYVDELYTFSAYEEESKGPMVRSYHAHEVFQRT